MRIISDTKDFYDCMQRLDQDRETVYVRKPKTIKWKNEDWPFPKPPIHGRTTWSTPVLEASVHVIGFCGKIYPMLDIDVKVPDHIAVTHQVTAFKRRCWNLQEIDSFLHGVLVPEAWNDFCSKGKKYRRTTFHDIVGRREKCEKFFAECAEKIDAYGSVFARSPIFVATSEFWHEAKIEYDAILKPYDFFKVFDTAAAWMELSMWMNNLAVPIKALPPIDDVTLAQAKGFDKYSFRKDKAKR